MHTHMNRTSRHAQPILSLLSVVGAWLGTSLVAQAQCPPIYSSQTFYAVGNVSSAETGDFNGDGHNDLVFLKPSGGFSLLLNDGNGSFTTTIVGASYVLASFCVRDVNSDGILDLIASSDNPTTTCMVFRGLGTGAFWAPMYFGEGGSRDIDTADFNGDGKVDVAYISATSSGRMSVMPGNGDGTFQFGNSFYAGQNPRRFVINDFNRDGHPDLATCNGGDNRIAVLLNDGQGAFAAPVTRAVRVGPVDLATGDLNADGNPDVVVVFSNNSGAQVLLGNGDGTFAEPVHVPITRPFGGSLRVAVDDMNADGKADIVITVAEGGFQVILGRGDGAFDPGNDFGGSPYSGVAVADLDGNAFPDIALAYADPTNGGVQVMMGTGFPSINISQPPVDQQVAPNQNAVFSVAAASTTGLPLTYQWRRNGVPIVDGGHFSGAATATLTVGSATTFEAGNFDVVLSGCPAELNATSSAAILSIAPTSPSCLADSNQDGVVNSQDFFHFVTAFFAGCP